VGQSLEKLGRPNEARSHFEELAGTVLPTVDETAPFEARMRTMEERADGLYQAALGLSGLGREDEARRFLEEALATDPSHLGATQLRRSWEVEP
jgi:tetratricopeptide (TPR) repeat protein